MGILLMYHTNRRLYLRNKYVIFDDIFSSAIVYTSQPYTEAMTMQPAVSYIPYAPCSKGKTGDICKVSRRGFIIKNLE